MNRAEALHAVREATHDATRLIADLQRVADAVGSTRATQALQAAHELALQVKALESSVARQCVPIAMPE